MQEPSDSEVDALVAANPGGMTAEQISQTLGVTRQRVFQLIDKAVAKVLRKLHHRRIYSAGDVVD